MRRFALILGLMALGCGDDATAPENRALPEGTYSVTYTACGGCSPTSTAGNIAAFADGETLSVEISAVTPDTAVLTLLSGNVLRFFADSTITLEYGEFASVDGPAYRGAVRYGSSATFFPIFRRVGDGLACNLGLLHPEYFTTPHSCVVN